jgi:hypothetical protein
MLRTNLFNQSDVINPVKNYFYGADGQITKESMKNRQKSIRQDIERAQKNLIIGKLTQEFGGRAVKIMRAIDLNKGTLTKEMLDEFELYRVKSSNRDESVLKTLYSGAENL